MQQSNRAKLSLREIFGILLALFRNHFSHERFLLHNLFVSRMTLDEGVKSVIL